MNAAEEFRAVPGFPLHRVSDLGRVQGCATSHGEAGEWRDLKPAPDKDGYLAVTLTHRRRCRRYRIPKLVLEVFAGPCPAGMGCRHLDGRRDNNRRDNLAWGTQADNQADRRARGKAPVGSNNPRAKLDERDAIEIRRLSQTGVRNADIARRYEVDPSTISHLLRDKTWRHV